MDTTTSPMYEPLLNLLLKQAPIVVLAVLVMVFMYRYMNRQIRYYQKRNETLSELLAASAVKHSEELLQSTERHCKEREQMRTELLLQCDSMSRNTLAFLKEGLLKSLGQSVDESDG
jgi:hypothetical protein